MRERVFVSFSVGSARKVMETVLHRAGCPELMPENSLSFLDRHNWLFGQTFDADDPRLAALVRCASEQGIRVKQRRAMVYMDDELRTFALVSLGIECNALEGSGPELGTKYDFSKSCARCGTGAVQTSPLRVPLSGLPKKQLACLGPDGEILVAQDLMEALISGGLEGIELRQVLFYRNDESLPWWQIISRYEMPKMSPDTRGIITDEVDHVMDGGMVIRALPPCPICRRDGHYATTAEPMQIAYRRSDGDLKTFPDVVHTWECFGRSRWEPEKPEVCGVAAPLILVTPNVFDIFRRLKVKRARFTPVRFV